MRPKFSILIFLTLVLEPLAQVEADGRARTRTNDAGSRSLGYKKSNKKTTPKPIYKWRPVQDSKLSLAKQKGIPENKIPEGDPEFEFLWPETYYDDYDFEHQRNMIQHGTWEAKRQNYHEAQLREAKEAAAKKKKEEEGDDEAIA